MGDGLVALGDDVSWENVGVSIDVGRGPPRFCRSRPEDGGAADPDGRGIEDAIDRIRCGAVRREIDLRSDRGGRDCDGERHVEEAAIHAELRVRHEAQGAAGVGAAGGGLSKVAFGRSARGDAGQFGQQQEIIIRGRLVQAVDGQHVHAVLQQVDVRREVEALGDERRCIRVFRYGSGIPREAGGSVCLRDFDSIQIRNEAVIVIHAQRELIQRRKFIGDDLERHSKKGRRVVILHGGGEICPD